MSRRFVPLAAGAAVVLFVELPRMILGTRSYVTLHDVLDSELANRMLASRPGVLLSANAVVPEVMNGLPRPFLPAGANFETLLFRFFSPFAAYAVNEAIVHAVAFAGMYLLGLKLLRGMPSARPVSLIVATLFALLPFYTVYGLSVAAHPLIAVAAMNLVAREKLAFSWGVMAAYPLYSIIPMATFFVLAVLAVTWAGRALRRRDPELPLLGGIMAMGVVTLGAAWPLILQAMAPPNPQLLPHRAAWTQHAPFFSYSGERALRLATDVMWAGHYHAPSLHTPILVFSVAVVAWGLRTRAPFVRSILVLAALSCVAAASYSVFGWRHFWPVRQAIPGLKMLNIRLYWFLPALWFAILALSGGILWRGRQKAIFLAFAAFQALWVVAAPVHAEPELSRNYAVLFARLAKRRPAYVTYDQFVSAPLFSHAAAAIGRPLRDLRVAAIGIHPAVLQMNGFFTLDGYETAYPLEYKKRFRPVIAGELARSPANRTLFDDWGHRCYMTPAQYGLAHYNQDTHGRGLRLSRFDLNFDAFRALGGTHVISAYEVRDPSFLEHTRLVGVFSDAPTSRDVHVYEVR